MDRVVGTNVLRNHPTPYGDPNAYPDPHAITYRSATNEHSCSTAGNEHSFAIPNPDAYEHACSSNAD